MAVPGVTPCLVSPPDTAALSHPISLSQEMFLEMSLLLSDINNNMNDAFSVKITSSLARCEQ